MVLHYVSRKYCGVDGCYHLIGLVSGVQVELSQIRLGPGLIPILDLEHFLPQVDIVQRFIGGKLLPFVQVPFLPGPGVQKVGEISLRPNMSELVL